MQLTTFIRSITVMTLAVELGCHSEDPTAPQATEALPVTVQTRMAAQGEAIPTIHASAAAGSITIRVTRRALCATEVSAAVRRGAEEIDIVSHVSSNALADCALGATPPVVVDYIGTVTSVSTGPYLIRVFEGLGDQSPQFVGSVAVRVAAP